MRVELVKPEPGPHQILVRMRAASLNFRDLAVVNGKYVTDGPEIRTREQQLALVDELVLKERLKL